MSIDKNTHHAIADPIRDFICRMIPDCFWIENSNIRCISWRDSASPMNAELGRRQTSHFENCTSQIQQAQVAAIVTKNPWKGPP